MDILLVEDNPGDVRLMQEVLKEAWRPINLHVVGDGVEALSFLRREEGYVGVPHPHLVFLDLRLPKKSGHEVLAEIKSDTNLHHIPVLVLTSSDADRDISQAYELHANCYITKPADLDQFFDMMKSLENFWLGVAKLPLE
ncbi:MAG: response regulator [Anaerolineae bacterium]